MTIIFELGARFWLETLDVTVTLTDPAGRITSSQATLERPGAFVGAMCVVVSAGDNDNVQAVGSFDVRGAGSSLLAVGTQVTAMTVRVSKQIGTAGNTVQIYRITVLVRGQGS